MANKKFSQFTAQAPSASTSYLVGYDSTANDNIRFQEGDLNLADMGGAINLATQTSGAIDLATQTSGDIDLTTQVAGILPEANGGTGVANMYNAQPIGRKGVWSMLWTSLLANVPRGAKYMLTFSTDSYIAQNGITNIVRIAYSTAPSGLTGLINPIPTQYGAAARIDSQVSKQLFKVTWRAYFYDVTADLDITAGVYTADNVTFTGFQEYTTTKNSAVEAVDSRLFEGSFYYEFVGSPTLTQRFFLPYVRFDNGTTDPFPFYDSNIVNGSNQFIIEQIY
jgi:hypothetical protein